MNLESSLPNDALNDVPNSLPQPIDDGACKHLLARHLPSLELRSTHGEWIDLASIPGWLVLYIYPMTGKPGVPIPDGWVEIPGAAGCTPQACSYRDTYTEFQTLNVTVYGLSAQSTDDQTEAAERLHLPYQLLSDTELLLANALNLPIFEVGELKLFKRVTLICFDGEIKTYFYPVFPPDKNASQVIEWLNNNAHD